MLTTTIPGTNSDFTQETAEAFLLFDEKVEEYWPQVGPILQKYVDSGQGEMAVLDILRFVRQGDMQLTCVHTAGDIRLVAITEFVQYPQYKVLRVVGLVGENPWVAFKFFPYMQQWALNMGAAFVETFATPDTVKLDMRLGFKPVYTLMRLPLKAH